MYVYVCGPIDYWTGWGDFDRLLMTGNDHLTIREVSSLWCEAIDLALRAGWEGDIRGTPHWLPIPLDDSGDYQIIIAWKQDNNGTTFVVTPFELPWLGKPAYAPRLELVVK